MPSLRSTALAIDPQRLRLYRELESLPEGHSITVWSPCKGEEGRKWCFGLQVWINWERKRRMHAAQIGGSIMTDEQMLELDAVVGVLRSLVQNSDGVWGVKFLRPAPFQMEKKVEA